ncbi:MAG: phosphoribosyltransferase family protein [Mycobacteriales bacterium]
MTAGSSQLLDLVPMRRGHFAYESGHHGDLWLDLDRLFARPHQLQPYVAQLASQLRPYGPEVVCGPLLGGAFVAQAVAAELAVSFCYSARVGGSYEVPVAFAPVLAGRRVAVVDDAINAGTAVLGTAAAVRGHGGRLSVAGALLLLGTPAALGVPVEHLTALPSALWTVAGCPLCQAGTPLDHPPS